MSKAEAAPARRPLVGIEELAERLSVSPWWVRGHIKKGDIPYKKLDRHVRFDLDEIDAWLVQNSRGQKPGA